MQFKIGETVRFRRSDGSWSEGEVKIFQFFTSKTVIGGISSFWVFSLIIFIAIKNYINLNIKFSVNFTFKLIKV